MHVTRYVSAAAWLTLTGTGGSSSPRTGRRLLDWGHLIAGHNNLSTRRREVYGLGDLIVGDTNQALTDSGISSVRRRARLPRDCALR